MNWKAIVELFRAAAVDWWKDNALRLSAALAFYTALSLSPLLLTILAFGGFIFGNEAAKTQLLSEVHNVVGPEGTQAVETILTNASTPSQGTIAMVVGFITILFGATGVFAQLQDALNTVWEVPPERTSGQTGLLKSRLLGFAMVCGLAFLLLVTLIVNAGLTAMGGRFSELLPGWETLLQIANFLVSLGVTALLFAMIYKVLPQVNLRWADVWVGAALTTVLFTVGKYLVGLYLGWTAVASSYGAAGSFVVLLIWLYYSSLILLYGAEFTQVYANRYGSIAQAEEEEREALSRLESEGGVAPIAQH